MYKKLHFYHVLIIVNREKKPNYGDDLEEHNIKLKKNENIKNLPEIMKTKIERKVNKKRNKSKQKSPPKPAKHK